MGMVHIISDENAKTAWDELHLEDLFTDHNRNPADSDIHCIMLQSETTEKFLPSFASTKLNC